MHKIIFLYWFRRHSGISSCLAAAAKSLQSYPTLCDPTDGSPPGSSVPGILQARILEWVAISFSNVLGSYYQCQLPLQCRRIGFPFKATQTIIYCTGLFQKKVKQKFICQKEKKNLPYISTFWNFIMNFILHVCYSCGHILHPNCDTHAFKFNAKLACSRDQRIMNHNNSVMREELPWEMEAKFIF